MNDMSRKHKSGTTHVLFDLLYQVNNNGWNHKPGILLKIIVLEDV